MHAPSVTKRLGESHEGLATDLSSAGFALRVSDPAFVRRTRVMPFVHNRTGMPKDIGDATGLWRLHREELSKTHIVATLRLLEEALGQSDLVAAFEALAS